MWGLLNEHVIFKLLQQAQESNDITNWVIYFVKLTLDAQMQANELVNHILKKSQFFDHHKNGLNERQLKVIQKMFDAGPDGIEGGMNATKYASITKNPRPLRRGICNICSNRKFF